MDIDILLYKKADGLYYMRKFSKMLVNYLTKMPFLQNNKYSIGFYSYFLNKEEVAEVL